MGEAKANKAKREELAQKYKDASSEIQKVLNSYSLALQPYLHFSEFGIIPQVRLVDNPTINESRNDEGSDSKEAGGSKKKSKSTDTK